MKIKLFLLLLLLIAWREMLLFISNDANVLLDYRPSFPYSDQMATETGTSRSIYSWANFDGVHYLTIIKKGYKAAANIQAFFPLYPVSVKIFSSIVGLKPIIVALLLSFTSLYLFMVLWEAELRKRYTESFAWKTLFILLFFPTSFFFVATYSESIFLVFFILTWIFARRKKWWLVGLSIAFASATRVIGILLIPAVFLDIWFVRFTEVMRGQQFSATLIAKSVQVFLSKDLKKLLLVSLGGVGLLGYMIYLQLEYHDPLAFFHVQSAFGAGRSVYLVTLPQVLWRSFRILQTVDPNSWKYFSYIQDTMMSLVFLALWGIGAVRRRMYKLSWGELTFSAGAYLLPTLTGTFSSMPRYILMCIPLFVVLSHLLSTKQSYLVWIIVSMFLLFLNTLLFIQGYWVA